MLSSQNSGPCLRSCICACVRIDVCVCVDAWFKFGSRCLLLLTTRYTFVPYGTFLGLFLLHNMQQWFEEKPGGCHQLIVCNSLHSSACTFGRPADLVLRRTSMAVYERRRPMGVVGNSRRMGIRHRRMGRRHSRRMVGV